MTRLDKLLKEPIADKTHILVLGPGLHLTGAKERTIRERECLRPDEMSKLLKS